MSSLDRLTIRGFKSIRETSSFELTNLNICIGGNGAGKSNLISFFALLRSIMEGNLNEFVSMHGGAGDLLHLGRKVTPYMEFELSFGRRGYRFRLNPTPRDTCTLTHEARYYAGNARWWEFDSDHDDSSRMVAEATGGTSSSTYSKPVYDAISSWQMYHFHDTSPTAGMRHREIIQDNSRLRMDASNIAPFLLKLRQEAPKAYREILDSIRLVIPFFDDFILEPEMSGVKTSVNLSWRQKGSDYPMQPYHLSDGSMRFICLAAALLQPVPPATIIIDEPELGLHPAAIAALAEMIHDAARRTQVIVATQSPALIDYFAVEDIIVVSRETGASTFSRLDERDFTQWLESYTLGELWKKNVISGGPTYE